MIHDQIMRSTLQKYMILKARSKISFFAFYKRITISQLFINQILKSDMELNGAPIIFNDQKLLGEFYFLLTRGCV